MVRPPLCIRCKGKLLCGRTKCPIYLKSSLNFKVRDLFKKEFFGTSPPSVFVSWSGYPNVSAGILSPPFQTREAYKYDSPKEWASQNIGIERIVEYRSLLVNPRTRIHIKEKNKKYLEILQMVGLSKGPIELEVKLKKKPAPKLNLAPDVIPFGPHGKIEKLKITENVKVERHIERIYYDDRKATDGIEYLYKRNIDEYQISKLFSIGVLGTKEQRKLVPTRWSITAVDDILAKIILRKIRNFKTINEFLVFRGSYLGNYFTVIMLPEVWSYELFEAWMPGNVWNSGKEIRFLTDYEGYSGRKTYAENTGGGYYASRLPCLQYLERERRQASIISLRFVTNEYFVPLGVFVVREAVRKALNEKPMKFPSKEKMLSYLRIFIKEKFGVNADKIFKMSKILTQRKITDFIF